MEKKPKIYTADELGINPPPEAHATAVLNNIGNGMMIGGVIPLTQSLYDMVTKKAIPDNVKISRGKWSLAFAGAGAVIGAVFGEMEGMRLQAYRHRVSGKIADQENRIAQLEENQQQAWAQREDSRSKATELDQPAR